MLTELTDNLDVIAALDDEPNDTGGLTAAQLKAKFDEAGNAIKDYLNDTHLPEHTAENIAFEPVTGVLSTNTQDAIEEVYAAGQAAVLGQIPDGSVTFAKLDTAAPKIIAKKWRMGSFAIVHNRRSTYLYCSIYIRRLACL